MGAEGGAQGGCVFEIAVLPDLLRGSAELGGEGELKRLFPSVFSD